MDAKDTNSTKIAKITRKRLMESVVPKNTREIILDQTPLLVKAIARKILKIFEYLNTTYKHNINLT